jgi:hypothetical protein
MARNSALRQVRYPADFTDGQRTLTQDVQHSQACCVSHRLAKISLDFEYGGIHAMVSNYVLV